MNVVDSLPRLCAATTPRAFFHLPSPNPFRWAWACASPPPPHTHTSHLLARLAALPCAGGRVLPRRLHEAAARVRGAAQHLPQPGGGGGKGREGGSEGVCVCVKEHKENITRTDCVYVLQKRMG